MEKEIGFALVGCGRISGHHVRSMKAVPNARILALCDLDLPRARQWTPDGEIPCYSNYHEMLAKHSEIDVVGIATPSGMHFEHAMDIVTRYRKHLVIEKPMVMTPQEGALLKEAAAKAGRKVFPIYQNRYNKAVQRVKQAIDSGELGDLVLATVRLRWCRTQSYYDRDPWRGTFSHDGGALTNQGIHYIDLLRFLAGDISAVNSSLSTRLAKIEVEDTATALVKFKSGASGMIEVTTAARPRDFEASISILGSKGTAILSGIATNQLVTFTPSPADEQNFSVQFDDAYGFGHIDLFKSIVAELRGTGKSLIEYEDGMETIRTLHALYRSDELGNWVALGDRPESARLGRPNDAISRIYRTPSP